MEELEAGYHQHIVAGAYAAAWYLRKRPGEWKKFLKRPFWNRAKKPKGDKGVREELHRVMMYVCDAISDQAYDRAFKYSRALEPYLVKNITPKKVRALIEKDGGLEKLYDRAKKEIPLRTGRAGGTGEPERNDDEEDGGDRSPNRNEGSKHQDRQQRLTLEIEISPKRLERVLGMSRGHEGILRFKALGAESDWHRFRATKLTTSLKAGGSRRMKLVERSRRPVAASTRGVQSATPGNVSASAIVHSRKTAAPSLIPTRRRDPTSATATIKGNFLE